MMLRLYTIELVFFIKLRVPFLKKVPHLIKIVLLTRIFHTKECDLLDAFVETASPRSILREYLSFTGT